MKISDFFIVISKASKILELYKNMSLEEALDKIYADLKEYKRHSKDVEKNEININLEYIVDNLKKKSKHEGTDELEKYTKIELVEIAKLLGIRVSHSSPKTHLVNEIINHFGYSQLNDMMAERNKP